MPTEKKQMIVTELADRLSRSNLVILADYRGLDMREMTTVRRGLQKAGAGFHVVKNTLFLRALEAASVGGLEDYLEGPTVVTFAYGDPIDAARALRDQAANLPALKLRGGWMEGRPLSAGDVQALAMLPPRPILLGRVAGTLQSPMAGLVNALAGVMRQLVYVLQARSEGAEAAAG